MATKFSNTPTWPQKPFVDQTVPSVISHEFASALDRLEYVQRLEARHAVDPFPLKQADAMDDLWMALTRLTSPKQARLPLRLGDHVLVQAFLLLHLVLQANGEDEHATVCAALYDLTEASADRVPPKIYALLRRAFKDVDEGYFPTVYPAADDCGLAPRF